uniref:Helicase ATP-binding domain-containing protein n=1 Tax=viral metagenome TaxID=1070528 RepID=A0A6C0BDV5_9ZZZZ
MNTKSNGIKIVKKGTPVKPIYEYKSGNVSIPMGSQRMYDEFNLNFSDQNTAVTTFSSPDGITMLTTMLNVVKCPLYVDLNSDKEYLSLSPELKEQRKSTYERSISSAFDKISLFISGLTRVGSKDLYNSYSEILTKISEEKLASPSIVGTTVVNHLRNLKKLLNSSSIQVVSDISKIVINEGSTESAKNKILNSSSVGFINTEFLSGLSSGVFSDFREYCIKYIGEGTKIVDETLSDANKKREMMLMSLFILKNEFKTVETKIVERTGLEKTVIKYMDIGTNSTENVNNFLIKCLEEPELVRKILKVFSHIKKFYPEYIETFQKLGTVFEEKTSFSYTLIGNDISKYIGGTVSRESSIIKTPYEEVEIEEEKFVESSKAKGKATKTASEIDFLDEELDTLRISKPTKGKKIKIKTITRIPLESSTVRIEINHVKDLMTFLNSSIKCDDSKDLLKKAKDNLNKVLDSTYGEEESEFVFDWWQDEYLKKTKNGDSFILVGDTSGGKTKVSILGSKIQINKYLDDPTAFIINIAPTSQLAIQQFSNLLVHYTDKSHLFGISVKSINDVPSTCRILVGTACEVEKYLYPVSFKEGTILNKTNIESEVTKAIRTPGLKRCRVLVIDEIQTLSPTYIQEKEYEKKMECKAMERIIQSVSYEDNSESQVIGISATLSRESIDNIKRKISYLTSIPLVSEIIYGFEDIGLSDRTKISTHIPIMQKQELYPIKMDGYNISKFGIDDQIVEQNLDNQVIESIIRHAIRDNVVPICFYRESELSTIEMYKSFINYLDQKNSECIRWHLLKDRYNTAMDTHGIKMLEPAKIKAWMDILDENIHDIIHNTNFGSSCYDDFDALINYYDIHSKTQLRLLNPIYSPELYGLLYEYRAIAKSNSSGNYLPFSSDVHPYYKFGTTTDDFFALKSPTGEDTTLNKILIGQDADPNENTSGIIPFVLKGLKYGVGPITSNIPIGIQTEMFRYINVKSKNIGSQNQIPVLFGEYGMTMGVNFNLMAVCIIRPTLTYISVSEYKQTNGRSGRRGVASTIAPRTYTFNIAGVYHYDLLETLTFNLSDIKSTFFSSEDAYIFLTNMIVKVLRNQDVIFSKENTNVEPILSGDAFKTLGGDDILPVRKIQLAKYQVKEMYDTCKNMFPDVTDENIRKLYSFLQKAEFYNLNVHIL